MTGESLTCVVRYIHHLAEKPVERENSDAELLHAFLTERDESAFRLLMQRHGHMVLSVCRRLLRQREDAEDAFQAVFLILARNAAGIRKSTSLASWLYGVAYRTSLKARAEMNKRRQREKQAAQARPVQSDRDAAMRELQAVLTEEVARLAEKYRAPFVLCCLEGMSRSEAARQLGWKEGTVSGRIAEARKRLQARLKRRGITLAASLCAVAVSGGAEAAATPLLIRTTVQAALGIAAGQMATGVVSAPVAVLMEGATRAMFLSKIKLAALVLAAAGFVAAAGSQLHGLWAVPAEGEAALLPALPAADKPVEKKPAAAAQEKDMRITGRILTLEGRPVKGASIHVREVLAPPEGDLTPVLKSIHRDGNRVFTHPLLDGSAGKHWEPMKTDDQGRFRLPGIDKERVVKLWLEGPTIEHQILYVLTRPKLDVKELVKSAPNRTGLLHPLPMIYGPTFEHLARPTKPITGIVRDRKTGKPLADVVIGGNIRNTWWENHLRTKTDKEGRYRLIGLPKTRSYEVNAWGLQQDYLQTGKDVRDSEGLAPITVDFELIRGVRVRGRITDKDTGKPVPAAIWYIPLESNKHLDDLNKDNHLAVGRLFAGLGHRNEKDGSYNLLALPGPGIIRVRAEVKDNPYTEAALDPADRGKTATNTPEEGMGVTFFGAGSIYETLMGHNAYRIIDPAADASSLSCDFTFDRGRKIKGTVVDPEGKPLTGVRVQSLTGLRDSKVLSGSSFQASALNPLQPRTIAFVHKERKLVGVLRLGGDEKEPVTVRLQSGAVLTGRVVDADGKPMPGVAVNVGYRKYPVSWVAGAKSIQTGTDGRFRIEGVFPDFQFSLSLRKGHGYLRTEEKFWELTASKGTKDLGDIRARRSE